MIEFRYCVTSFENVILECSGHAGYAEFGKDIVCAGASTLMSAAREALQRYDEKRYNEEIRDGYVKLRCRFTPETAAVARTVICGMEWISAQHPKILTCEPFKKN